MDKNKELQRKQEDAAFAHGLCWVGGAVVAECFLMLINQYFFNFTTSAESIARAEIAYKVMMAAFVVAPIVFVIAAVKGFLSFKKSGTICPVVEGALGLSAAISLSMSMSLIYNGDGATMMLLFLPVAGALAFTFFLYQRDFFYSAAISGMAGLVLWMIWHTTSSNMIVAIIGTAKVVVFGGLFCFFAAKLKEKGGVITLLGYEVRFLPKDAIYPVIYTSAGLSALAVLVAMVLGGYVAYYLIFAMAAWIFALLVYYTVRML